MQPRISNSRAFFNPLTAAVGAALLGCYSTLPVPQSDGQLEGNPKVVTVTRKNGSHVTVYLPAIARDSLIGWSDEPMPNQQPQSRVAVSVGDIQRISATKGERKLARDVITGTGMLVLGAALLLGLGFALYAGGME